MKKNDNKTLSVRLYGKEIGLLKQNDNGNLSFVYLPTTKRAISQSLPLQTKPFTHKQCFPYFNGLLPESEQTRNTLAKIFHISAKNDFSLLNAIGGDCAGALSFVPPDTEIKEEEFIKLEGLYLTDDEWVDYINNLPQRPLGNSLENRRRLSLAGAQDKTSITMLGKKMNLPAKSTPSSHILKTAIKQIPHTILNEYLCLRLAKKLGLNIPKCDIVHIKNLQVLLVERYDREKYGNKVKRIHQEDFCQALAVPSNLKYQTEGGPGLKECFALLSDTKNIAKNKLELARRVMFNFLIGNNDAHAKNFSLLYTEEKPDLAPAYDLICTAIYPELDNKMAMKIGSYREREWVNKKVWQSFCDEVEISYPWFSKTLTNMANDLPKAMKNIISKISLTEEESNWTKTLIEYCQNNADLVKDRLK